MYILLGPHHIYEPIVSGGLMERLVEGSESQ